MNKTIWIARDKNGILCLYTNRPYRLNDKAFGVNHGERFGFDRTGCDCSQISSELYLEVTWENSPKELVIKV
jgi:hypothetical protein